MKYITCHIGQYVFLVIALVYVVLLRRCNISLCERGGG